MQQDYYVSPPPPRQEADRAVNPWIIRLILLGITGVFLLGFAMVAMVAGYQFMTQDQIYAGITPIYGVDLTGMTKPEAISALNEQSAYGANATFTLTYADQSWEFTGEEMGISFDVEATVNRAYEIGREGNFAENLFEQWRVWRDGRPVSPVITYDRNQAQSQISLLADSYINQAVQDATLVVSNGTVETTGSQAGRSVDVTATLTALEQNIFAMNTTSTIPLTVVESNPTITDASVAAEMATLALNPEGITFQIRPEDGADAGPWTALPESIENMLRVERVDNGDGSASYDVYVINDQAREFLNDLQEELYRAPQSARFIFNDTTQQLDVIEPSVNGRRIDVEATLGNFQDAVFSETNRTVDLVFEDLVPLLNNNASAEELGIRELVAEATTFYVGSTPARRANIQVAAAKFHGIVIPPQSEFSFNEWLGEVDQDSGFEEALIIVGDQTITGVGGGVCQVSSTIFQAAFYGGFPILERYAHGYRIGYYEVGEGPGMDATVYSPIIDFRFFNDTPHHLLLETYVYPSTAQVTFRLYSTSMNREVVKEGPIIQNEQPPPPAVYRANANLTPGQVNQTDYAVSGAEVFIYRTVYQDGEVLIDKEQFYSNYIPWPAQFEVAPGDSRLDQ